jgi:hypothetical protein
LMWLPGPRTRVTRSPGASVASEGYSREGMVMSSENLTPWSRRLPKRSVGSSDDAPRDVQDSLHSA